MSDGLFCNGFKNTLNALSALENQLKCSSCGLLAQSPCILGGCEHVFCHVCVEKYLGASCPHCHIPAHVKDADVNRQLFNIANLCQKLRNVLSTSEEDVQTIPNGETYNEGAECTPKQPIKDVYHFDTPTEKETTNQTKPGNGCGKKNKKSEKKNTKADNHDANIKQQDEKTNVRGKGRRRRASLQRSSDDVPNNQSTMTQFYDYDENNELVAQGLGDVRNSKTKLQSESDEEKVGIEAAQVNIDKVKMMDLEVNDEKGKRKRKKAAEIITEICKTTTRLRRKSDIDVKNLDHTVEDGRTNWFEGTATVHDKENISDILCKSIKDNGLEDNTNLTDSESHQELLNTSAVSATREKKTKRRSTKGNKISSEPVSKTTDDTSFVQTEQSPKHPSSKRSKSPSTGEENLKDTGIKVKDNKLSKIQKESNESTPVNDAASSTPKSGSRKRSKGNLERKSVTPQSAKAKRKSGQQRLLDDSTSSPKTPKLPSNKSTPCRSKVSGSPAGISPRTTIRATPQRSKGNDIPAALSPALNKRNAKGETPLQVASIKNDERKVAELLAAGANPNVRDNAGWSPLHEACNRGYTAVARMLLDHGAMMNVPGLDNDTPLHDAVSNGRIECVKLLVSRGASLTARNLQGFTPEELAVSKEMKQALKTAVRNNTAQTTQLPLDTLEYQQPCLLGTSLSREQKVTLQKCSSLLSAKQSDECTAEITHVITSCNEQGLCARTIKYLQAVLTGKWILSMDWVNTCLELGSKVCEEGFEVQGTSTNPSSKAPLKGRLNRKQQLPGLFDGCQFYFHGNFEFSVPSKDDLIEVIRSGGGKILSREPKPGHLDSLDQTVPYHANPAGKLANCCVFIVHQNFAEFQPIRTKHMCSVPVSWILDSAAEFKLQDVEA